MNEIFYKLFSLVDLFAIIEYNIYKTIVYYEFI